VRAPRAAVALLLALACAAAPAAGDEPLRTEVVELSWRSSEEMIEVLRPLVPAPGSVSGLAGRLVIRADPATLAMVREVIAKLDRAPANLLISVRFGETAGLERERAAASGTIGTGGISGRIELRAATGEGRSREVHRLRVLEGREAFIASGESVPVGERRLLIGGSGVTVEEGVRYVDVSRGFWVRARLRGDRVELAIAPRRDALAARGGGAIRRRALVTTLVVPLGRWVALGGVERRLEAGSGGIALATGERGRGDFQIHLRVDRLP